MRSAKGAKQGKKSFKCPDCGLKGGAYDLLKFRPYCKTKRAHIPVVEGEDDQAKRIRKNGHGEEAYNLYKNVCADISKQIFVTAKRRHQDRAATRALRAALY